MSSTQSTDRPRPRPWRKPKTGWRLDEQVGYAAGALRSKVRRAGVDPAPSGVDAIVATVADARAGREDVEIVTSDADDMELLASLADHADRLSVVSV